MARKAVDGQNLLPRIAVAAVFLVVFALLIWRAFHGLDWTDESFYAAEAWRIILGDAVFKDTWSSQQLSAMIYSPLVAAYTGTVGSTDGILLFLRLSYLVACGIVALLLFFSAQKETSMLWALLASIPVLAAISPTAFSYNTIQFLGFFAACAFIFSAQQAVGCKRMAFLVLAGICCGTAFVAYPTTLLAFPVFCLWLLLEPGFGSGINARARNLVPFAVGCALCLAAVATFVILNSSFEAVASNWQNLFAEQPKARSPADYLFGICKSYGPTSCVALAATCLIAFASNIAKDSEAKRALRMLAFIGAAGIIVWQCVRVSGTISTGQVQLRVYFAIAMTGLVLFIINKCRWHQSIWMFLVGVVLSVAVYYGTSNAATWCVYPYVLGAGATLLYFPTMTIWTDDDSTVAENNALKTVAALTIAALVVAFVSFFTYVYRDAPLREMDTQLESGPGAGLITTSERARLYYNMVDTIHEYAPEDGSALFLKVFPFGYLCTTSTPGAANTFSPNVNGTKLARYYEANPQKIPSVIFLVGKDYYGEENHDIELGSFFESYMLDHPYSTIETDAATIIVFEDNLRHPSG